MALPGFKALSEKIGRNRKQFLVFLLFLVLSTAFWFSLRIEESSEYEFAIGIKLTNVPDDVVLTTEPPKRIYVTLRDAVGRLIRYSSFLEGDITLTFDFARYAIPTKGYGRIPQTDVIKALSAKLTPSTQLTTLRPDTIDFYFNYGASRQLPVRFQGTIKTEQGYALTYSSLSPDSVMVYAAENILDTMTCAPLGATHLASVKDTMLVALPFDRIRGVKFDPAEVQMTLFADRMVEKTLNVKIRANGFPQDKVLRLFPSRVDVTCQVGMRNYNYVVVDDFVVEVDYGDFSNARGATLPLHLVHYPSGASYPRLHLQEVEYVIEDM